MQRYVASHACFLHGRSNAAHTGDLSITAGHYVAAVVSSLCLPGLLTRLPEKLGDAPLGSYW
jgi:hypothetical protein